MPLINHTEFRNAARDRFGALGFGAAGDTLSREELANILAELLRKQEEVQSSQIPYLRGQSKGECLN